MSITYLILYADGEQETPDTREMLQQAKAHAQRTGQPVVVYETDEETGEEREIMQVPPPGREEIP